MKRSPFGPILLLLLLSLACASPDGQAPATSPQASAPSAPAASIPTGQGIPFRCNDGTKMIVDFTNDVVRVKLEDGRSYTLARALSGSGAKYSDGANLFWEHRGEAYVVLDGVPLDQCAAE